jgi:hypothetical protein
MKKILSIFVLLLSNEMMQLNAQLSTEFSSFQKPSMLNIFLDCNMCDMNHIRENFNLVNYVRDRIDADVHILISATNAGGGGEEFKIIYIGQKKFEGIHDTTKFYLPPDHTLNEGRVKILENLKLGLVPFLLKTDQSDKIFLSIKDDTINNENFNQSLPDDKWKNWVFNLYGSGSYSGQKSMNQTNLNSGLYVTRITNENKLETSTTLYFQEMNSIYDIDGTTISFRYYSREFSNYNIYVKSLGEHWGIGGLLSNRTSSFSNLDFQMRVEPAIEYNFFKYSQSSHKQLRFLYSAGYEYSDYHKITIYNRNQDFFFRQNLKIGFMLIEPWGFINASVYGSNYIHDFAYFFLGSDMIADINIFSGFSISVGYGINMHRNQISLVKDNYSSVEEVLTRQREMETNFSYYFRFGVSYTFGSKFNNIVNPRFSS